MFNPFTCDNCLFNPAQYNELGTRVGYCLKHSSLLKKASLTTCKYHVRKDLPSFVCEEGQQEHGALFANTRGICFYKSKIEYVQQEYSERAAWEHSFDPYLHEVAIYHRSAKKWVYLQAFLSSRSPIKSLIHSCLTRRYIAQCGPERDNYRIVLAICNDIGSPINLYKEDFRSPITNEYFEGIKEHYIKEIELLRLYCIQEYGHLVQDENLQWISDDLNGALETSLTYYRRTVRRLSKSAVRRIIEGATRRGVFYVHQDL